MKYWRTFVKAGNSTFTLEWFPTGERYTYHVRQCPDKPMWWVKVLNGPDNISNWEYIGTIFGDRFEHTRKSRVSATAKSFRWFAKFSGHFLHTDIDLPSDFRFYPADRCGRCGRLLTVPTSIEWGFGPECVTKVFNAGHAADHVPLELAKKIRRVMELERKKGELENVNSDQDRGGGDRMVAGV